MMRRREFITLLGGAAAAWPLEARAQAQKPAMPVGRVPPHHIARRQRGPCTRIPPGPERNGSAEGENVAVEYRWADNQSVGCRPWWPNWFGVRLS